MSDIIDSAQTLDELYRESALIAAKMRHGSNEDPLIINGVRCCLDCEVPIPGGRLDKVPDARRCVNCQTKIEKHFRKGAV